MRDKLKLLIRRFANTEAGEQSPSPDVELRLAVGVLLFEVARMDQSVDAAERGLVLAQLRKHYGIDDAALSELMAEIEQTTEAAVSYHPYTSELVSRLTLSQRVEVIEQMWAVALADGEIDMHEEHLIRKIADLLYVPHKAFIAAKLRVTEP